MVAGKGIKAVALTGLAAMLCACVGPPRNAPAWFTTPEAARDRGYPSLHDVPRGTIANTDAAYWARQESELLAAGAAMKANPRAAPAAEAEDPGRFVERAREELEAARGAHTP